MSGRQFRISFGCTWKADVIRMERMKRNSVSFEWEKNARSLCGMNDVSLSNGSQRKTVSLHSVFGDLIKTRFVIPTLTVRWRMPRNQLVSTVTVGNTQQSGAMEALTILHYNCIPFGWCLYLSLSFLTRICSTIYSYRLDWFRWTRESTPLATEHPSKSGGKSIAHPSGHPNGLFFSSSFGRLFNQRLDDSEHWPQQSHYINHLGRIPSIDRTFFTSLW